MALWDIQLILELKFIADIINLSAWSTEVVDEKNSENRKMTKKPVFHMTNQERGILWMAELSQVQVVFCCNQICYHQTLIILTLVVILTRIVIVT